MEKKFYDASVLPEGPVTIKLNNLQFELKGLVIGTQRWKHIYTEDSLKRAVLMASKEMNKKGSDFSHFMITVYDAKGEALTRLGIVDIYDLCILKEYLK